MASRIRILATAGFFILAFPIAGLLAAQPDPLCRDAATDDKLRPIPDSLVPAATELLHLEAMPADQVQRSTYYRCAAGRVLVCNAGANLPCGKANTSRQLDGAEAWSAEHPGSDFIPMYVTGHDTVYRWRCHGAHAATIGAPIETDRRGFIAQFWKRIDATAR